MKNFSPLTKVDVAEQLVIWLNTKGISMTYTEFGKIIGHPAPYVGNVLDEVNVRHKARGGTDMVTACVVSKRGVPGAGYKICAENHALKPEIRAQLE